MQLELKDKEGIVGTIELSVAELLKEAQDSGSALVAELLKAPDSGSASVAEPTEQLNQGKKSLIEQVSQWIDTQVIAEMVIDHLKAEGIPVTFEQAKAVWLDTLEALGSHLAELGKLQDKVLTMDDYSSQEKAGFVITWAKGLSPENKAIFAQAVGIPIAGASEAEVAEAEEKAKAEKAKAEESLDYIQGKTDKPGYKYLEHLNLSVKE